MNKSGKYVTNLSGDMEYKSFTPAALPPAIDMDDEMVTLLVEANKQIYALESIAAHIPSIKLFTSMYVRKEALMSSQIEGTQATLEDVLDPTINQNANRDLSDVVNYIKATDYAVERLNTLPLCNRLIRETHAVLMHSVRGEEKSPGEYELIDFKNMFKQRCYIELGLNWFPFATGDHLNEQRAKMKSYTEKMEK